MRSTLLLLGALAFLAPDAVAQEKAQGAGAGAFCASCRPLYGGQIYSPTLPSRQAGPLHTEAQDVSMFSPWIIEHTLKAPALQYVTVNTPTVSGGGVNPTILVESPSFTSPGVVRAVLEATVDHYASLNRQQVGFYFAYWVKEDTNKNGTFCEAGEPCGYLDQHTAGAFYGISGSFFYAPDLASTTVINQLWPVNMGFTFLTTPGTTCAVEVHVWPAHFFTNVSRPLRWGNVRLRIVRGPSDGS